MYDVVYISGLLPFAMSRLAVSFFLMIGGIMYPQSLVLALLLTGTSWLAESMITTRLQTLIILFTIEISNTVTKYV